MSYVKYISLILAVLLGCWIGIDVSEVPLQNRLFKTSYRRVCEIVRDNYFKPSDQLNDWLIYCFERAETYDAKNSIVNLVKEIDGNLDRLEVSHLGVWDPIAMRSQWLGESKETGLRARKIKNHFVVIKLVEGGPAMRAGIQLGDEIVEINGLPVDNTWQIRSTPGSFLVRRRESGDKQVPIHDGLKEFLTYVDADEIRIDSHPVFELADSEKSEKVGVLTIPSFVSTYFDRASWLETVAQIKEVDKLVIDIRENAGGNFAAMLRALSPFFCKPTHVGKLQKPRRNNGIHENLKDNMDPEYQTELIDRVEQIDLKTFSSYGCFSKDIVVLADGESASTAEVFAQAFLRRKNTAVWGDFTAGEVVQAVWHPLPLGTGFALSVPDSMFLTDDGLELEGIGVRPTKLLDYDLDLARDGIDSWIQEAVQYLSR